MLEHKYFIPEPGVPRISVFTGSKHIEPSFEAWARPKSATWKIKTWKIKLV
jgi:hypothetical protein